MQSKSTVRKNEKEKPKTRWQKKDRGKLVGGISVTAIELEVTPEIPGATDLMKAAHSLDVELVETALLLNEDPHALDSKGNDALKYLFAGYNLQMCYFRRLHPGSDIINRGKMSKRDLDRYDSLTENLVQIIELIRGDHARVI